MKRYSLQNDKMKKKIAIIGAKGLPASDGISRVVECYLPYLTGKYDITVFCTEAFTDRKSGFYDGYEEVVLSRISNARLNTLWYYIKAVWIILFKRRFDLVHFHHSDAAFLFSLLRLKYGKRLLVTTHGAFHDHLNDKWKRYEWYFKLQYNHFLKSAGYITGVSLNEKRKGEQIIGREIRYIPNGINADEPVSGKDVGTDYIFFAAGRIMEIKGLDLLLEACHRIDYTGKIKVAGSMDFTPKDYAEKIANLAEGLDVEFLGMIKDKSLLLKYLKSARLFVFPSRVEALSMQLLEGVSMRTHTIASDITANVDVFNEKEMLFFHSDDSSDLADKINYAFSHPDDMDGYAETSYVSLLKNYTWSGIAEQYDEEYQTILKANGKG